MLVTAIQSLQAADTLRPISDRAMLGNGDEYEERLIGAATALISRTIGHYATGDRRFTALMWNVMLGAALTKAPAR